MGRKLPKPISHEDFKKLLAKAKEERESFRKPRSQKLTPRGERINQYMISMILGFYSGLRISEIVGYKNTVPPLGREQIEDKMIRVVSGKGGKDRLTPKPKLLNSEAIKNLPLSVSRRSLQGYVEKLGNEVLNKHITFHQMRHGFVTHCLEKGMPIHVVQAWAGHSRMDTTGLYSHVLRPEEHLKKYEEVF